MIFKSLKKIYNKKKLYLNICILAKCTYKIIKEFL